MLQKILPREVNIALSSRLNMDKLYEVRLRSGGVVSLNYGGTYYFFGKTGLLENSSDAFECTQGMLQDVVMRAADYSVYASTKQINSGFLSVQGGIRLGICGEVVWDNNQIRAIKNFCALNIRVPHQVLDCAKVGFEYIYCNGLIRNTLILSPPGAGKTTYLRDLTRLFGEVRPVVNTLLVDERSEIAACYNGVPQLNVGDNTDTISNCNKAFAFEQGIRAMRPDLIVTDELASAQDLDAIAYAMSAGVKTVASIHAYNLGDLCNKAGFRSILDSQIFERFIVLGSFPTVGTVVQICDHKLNELCGKVALQ